MFQQSSRKLKKKYWWQNLKMKLWLGGCGIVILITIICIIYFSVPHGGGSSSGAPCKSGNKTYQHGESYYDDCNRCECSNGSSICTAQRCPKSKMTRLFAIVSKPLETFFLVK